MTPESGVPTTRAAIPITRPFFDEEELRAVQRPLESGWVVQGPFVREFETAFGRFVGSPNAVAVSSCTAGLHLAVAALGLRPGDEVIVPAFTWVATPNVVEYVGATPVFVDIDLATFNIAPEALDDAITDRTVGIIPVHLFGLCADMDRVTAVARARALWVLEDAACGFGASSDGRSAGTMGDAGVFSFHPRKSITTGEGGMITTASSELDASARSLRDHGASRSDLDRHLGRASYLLADYDRLGYNYRLTDLQAAVGVAQLAKAPWILQRRREIAARYDEALQSVGWLRTPVVPRGHVHGYQSYVTLVAPEEPTLGNVSALHERRNRLMDELELVGIATRQGTHSPILQGFYREKYGLRAEEFPNAVLADRLSMSLPLFPQMTTEDQDRVIEAIVYADF
jgi:dTDP-4-amino-4,6-dideoxygalactose transaminase